MVGTRTLGQMDGWKEGVFDVRLNERAASDLKLIADAQAFLHPAHREQMFDISVNEQAVATWTFRLGETATSHEAYIPASLINEDRTINITIIAHNPESPWALGLSTDARLLGLALRNIKLDNWDAQHAPVANRRGAAVDGDR
jgi:hypothetical protein